MRLKDCYLLLGAMKNQVPSPTPEAASFYPKMEEIPGPAQWKRTNTSMPSAWIRKVEFFMHAVLKGLHIFQKMQEIRGRGSVATISNGANELCQIHITKTLCMSIPSGEESGMAMLLPQDQTMKIWN